MNNKKTSSTPYICESEEKIMEETDKYLEIFKNNPYIFNLGHGILPNTNPEVIKKIVNKVKLIKRWITITQK